MTVCVDELEVYPNAWGPFLKGSCHLYATGNATAEEDERELLRFAVRMGLRREWYQAKDPTLPHFDLTRGKRAQAVRRGATEHTRQELVAVMKANRARRGLRGPAVQMTLIDDAEKLG